MYRPITTLFMLESLDGKISSGSSDNLDADKDFCRINKVDKLTIQSGGTLNGLFVRDKFNIVIAPIIVGGKDVATEARRYHID